MRVQVRVRGGVPYSRISLSIAVRVPWSACHPPGRKCKAGTAQRPSVAALSGPHEAVPQEHSTGGKNVPCSVQAGSVWELIVEEVSRQP